MEALTLDELKAEIDSISADMNTNGGISAVRLDTDDIRYARWDGQASDGLKHEDNLGEEPEPFEGATDTRIRLADLTINEEVMLLITAALRAQINFKGCEQGDREQAANMAIFMRWLLRNYLGLQWIRELVKLANYFLGDSPGVGLMGIYWRQERALRLETISAEDLMTKYLQEVRMTAEEAGVDNIDELANQAEQAALDFLVALEDKGFGEDYLAELLMQFYPIKEKRARKVIRQLRKEGKAEFPVMYIKRDGPEVQAKRLYTDWFISANTTDFQTARCYFEVEWLSLAQALERQVTEGWNKEFVKQLTGELNSDGKRSGGKEGEAGFPAYVRDENGTLKTVSSDYYKGLYQVITAYYMGIDEDGIPGRYYVPFHKNIDVPAKEPQLLNYAHGKYPGHVFQREILSSRLLDSRGIAELSGATQGLLKMYLDSFGDHAQIAGVPPIITRGRQRQGALRIKSLMEIPIRREDDMKWFNPPEYPKAVRDMIALLQQYHNEYFGRSAPDVPEDVVRIQREFKVFLFLLNVREALDQIFKLCQQFAPEELILRVTNRQGERLFRTVEEIQGEYDLELTFEPKDMDIEYLKAEAEIIKNLFLPMDRDLTIKTAPIVQKFLARLSPDLAEESIRSVDAAQEDETRDELKQYQVIRSGAEPVLPDDGSVNYALRLQLYRDMQAMNPEIFNDMAPDKLAILQSRMERLATLTEQYGANAEIGRQGGRTALAQASAGVTER